MSDKTLIIVESPTKAKTISKFLGRDYVVKSSYGHIRDLPTKKIGIDVKHDFEPEYVIPDKAKETVEDLKKAAKNATTVILATDEDREGEAIAWHLVSALGLKKADTERIVFHEITKKAIEEALKHPRKLDNNLIDAQQARRILDRLVGYELSPLLWKKIARGLSAGRVQSAAVRLIVDREEEIRQFKTQEYWTIEADLNKKGEKENFVAKLAKKDDKAYGKFDIGNKDVAQGVVDDLKDADYKVADLTKRDTTKNPPAPFTTSTLQQEASNKLGYSAKKTMMMAQQLYEGVEMGTEGSVGLITYMRTDSLNLSADAVAAARQMIEKEYGADYRPAQPVVYKTKSKGAQEAHEAIRPSDPLRHPEQVKDFVSGDQYKVYKLIWERMVASQMSPAIFEATSINIAAKNYQFNASGQVMKFEGFLKVYQTKSKETILPALKVGDALNLNELKPIQHFTEPPARYTEAALIKAMEEHGIGRPSTYAPTISTVQDRNYVIKDEEKKLRPTEMGEVVNKVLVQHFPNIVDLEFTAKMEENLDKVAAGEEKWVPVIRDFYVPFKENLVKKDKEIDKKEVTETATSEICDKCGSPMVIKIGRFGKFLACSNYPDCKNTKQLAPSEGGGPARPEPEKTDEVCDKCGKPMVIKVGRFGKFLACTGYPDCKNVKSIIVPTGVKCPECGKGDIVERKSKKGKIFYSCSRYPDCKFALWNKPTGEKCPKCGQMLVYYGKENKVKCSSKECDYKKE